MKQNVLSRSAMRRNALASLGLAIVVSCTYWFASLFPLPARPSKFLIWLFPKLDFIPSAFALILPIGWTSGFHQYFRPITYCFPGPLWWETMRYLRTAIPAYTLLFFAANLLERFIVAVIRSQRNAGVPAG